MAQLTLSSQPRAASVDFPPCRTADPRTTSGQTSNRNNKLLEFPVTYTKQTAALISNRNKMRFSPVPFVDGANENPSLTAHDSQFAASQARASLIANEMRSPGSATISKHATYIFLIANEFHFTAPVFRVSIFRSRLRFWDDWVSRFRVFSARDFRFRGSTFGFCE